MKKLIMLLAIAASIWVYAPAAVGDIIAPEKVIPPGRELVPPKSGIVRDYYIGMHHPRGDCNTEAVSAKTTEQALKAAQARCPECLVEDLTDNFRSGMADLMAQTQRYCPIR